MKLIGLVALLLLACSKPAEPPPYGFGVTPEQSYRFEADERTEIDGTLVAITRGADVVLRAQPGEESDAPGTEILLFLERYELRISGGPGGDSELSISAAGVRAVTAEGPAELGPNDKTPDGDTVLEMRARPAASVVLDSRGAPVAGLWSSPHSLLTDLSLLDWLLMAFPTHRGEAEPEWLAKRVMPRVGKYTLGLEVPVRWKAASGALELASAGALASESVRVAAGLEGPVSVETRGEAELDTGGRVRQARLDLSLDFTATNGTHVASSHSIRIRCTSCGGEVNSPAAGSDSGGDRDGISQQQGHVDDLPDHGGVRRGF